MSSWINWVKDAFACKRCGKLIHSHPCMECGFDIEKKPQVIDGEGVY